MNSALNFADTIAVMQELGISIMNADGEFRCLAEILDELSHKWNHCCGFSKSSLIADAADTIIYAFSIQSEYELLPPEDDSDELAKFLSEFKITGRR